LNTPQSLRFAAETTDDDAALSCYHGNRKQGGSSARTDATRY
jgi:hypothetical protein